MRSNLLQLLGLMTLLQTDSNAFPRSLHGDCLFLGKGKRRSFIVWGQMQFTPIEYNTWFIWVISFGFPVGSDTNREIGCIEHKKAELPMFLRVAPFTHLDFNPPNSVLAHGNITIDASAAVFTPTGVSLINRLTISQYTPIGNGEDELLQGEQLGQSRSKEKERQHA